MSGAATAQIGSQGTTINAHRADETVLSTDWVTDILDTIQYENTSGSAPSSVQISVSFTTAPESGDNYGAITPPTQYFTINLTPLPSVQAGTVSVTSGGSVAGTAGTAGSGALAGDSDANGYDLSVSAVSGGSLGSAVHGTYGDLTLNADGSFAYVSGANATELGNLAGATGQVTDNFTFTVSDGHGGSVAATLSVNVDDSKPDVTGIGFVFPSTQLGAGESGTIVLAVSNVGAIDTTKGIPTLTLNDGGTATFDAAKSSSSELVFDYTVSAGDTDVGSLAVSSVNLNGAVANASGVVATSAVSIAGLTQHGPQIGSGGGAPADMSTLVTFTGGASSLPQTTLVIDAAGNLYGETTGPQGSTGTIFEIAKTGGLYSGTPGPINTGLMVVDPNDHLVGNATQTLGVVPQSALLIDAAGSVLFSNTVRAGLFTPSQQDASVQTAGANFVAPDVLAAKVGQWAPQIALVTGNEMFVEDELTGRLDVFKGVNASAFEQVNLGNITDVILPVTGVKGAMAVDGAGNVFGTTANGAGSIFELPNNGGTIGAPITLATFNGLNGADPEAGLIADSAGDLFGTTFSGGAFNNGTVFELVKSGSSYTLASFNGTNGANPLGALIEDGAGNLFGTTEAGGANGDGTVFEIANTSTGYASTPTTLVSFNGANGAMPETGLTFDAAGNLFGTTTLGGANNAGTVFELSNVGFDATIAPWVTTEHAAVTSGRSVSGTAGSSGTGAVAGDVDYDGLVHSVSAIAGGTLGTVVHGTYGDLTLNADGSFNYVDAANATELAAIRAATGPLTDTFAYMVTDGHGHSGGATLDISLDRNELNLGPQLTGAVTTPSSGAFNAGKTITILLEMNEAVTVTGTDVTLTLSNGGTATLDAASTASLQHLGVVAFDYKVASTDQDAAGLSIASINLNTTTISDSSGFPGVFPATLSNFSNVDIETTAPTIALTDPTQPVQGTSAAGAAVTFSATTTDFLDGTSDPVVFTEGQNVVHSGDTFSFGNHTITASATDTAGNTTSETFTVTVQGSTPPVLTPVANQTDEATSAAGATAIFSAIATDLVDGTDPVVFKEGSTVVHSGDTFALGAHTITASATDTAGNSSSETFTVTVRDTTPPMLTPVANQTDEATGAAGAAAVFSATATDLVDGTDPVVFKEGSTVVHSGGTFAIGTHTITASATDAAGNSSSETFTVTVRDTTAPVLTPVANQTDEATGAAGAVATFSATATDLVDGPDTVVFKEGSTVVHSGGTFAIGTHTITASSTDAAGNSSSETFTVTVRDTTAPDTSIVTGPSSLSNSNQAAFTVKGTDAVGVTGFAYKIDNGSWASTASSSIALTGLSDGSHVFQVAAFDAAGNLDATPASFNWTVDTKAPTVSEHLLTDTGTSSTDKITSNDALTGSGDPNAVVHFTVDGVAIGATATASGTGAWSFTPTGLLDGVHTIVASETDLAGNTGSSSLTFTLDTKAPQSEVTSIAQNGNAAKATVTFGGLSEAGSTILKIVENQIGGGVVGTDGNGSSTVLATASASGGWSVTTGTGFSYSSSNDYKIDVTAKDVAGNVSTISTFIGTAKADTLVGTSGNDFLYGGAKGDVLTGGAGSDTFVYKAITDSQPGMGNFDTIKDFTHGSDHFDFSGIAGLNSNNHSVAINILTGNAPASIAAHTIDVVINGGNAVLYANASGFSESISTGHEDMQINLTSVTSMSASDFLLHF
ncbi:choice-of-anchor tandem repeat GloVer-containing protein [Bradyrhizobium sp. 26S5]|uniref:beta strand repeat-containing protein n=1 Tax=Bradyrhizobium sp. 26S5 TaxID=3139729 RepID=UPI0030D3D88A